MHKTTIKELSLNGMLIALVFIATYFIQIRLPLPAVGGLVHAGNIALFTIAALLGAKRGAIAGAFGMSLFDVLSIWVDWAPGTFVVRGVMGFMIGYIFEWGRKKQVNYFITVVIAVVTSSIWMLSGYYVVEGLIYSNWIAPINSMPGDIMQIVIGWVVALPLYATFKRMSFFKSEMTYE